MSRKQKKFELDHVRQQLATTTEELTLVKSSYKKAHRILLLKQAVAK